MRHVFIINPAAGHRDQTEWFRGEIRRCCQGLDYEIHVSHAPGVCRSLARRAAQQGDEVRLYACGGDGTLNEVAAGAAGFPNAAVTHYRGGSGNDFVRLFSDTAPFRDLEQLLKAKEVTLDLVDCNGDYSLNICSVGLDARIGTEVAFYKRLPFISGHFAYLVSTVRNVIRGISEHYIVEIDGKTVDAHQTMICVANGRYYGGGFNPVPEADPTDGMLDVLLVKKVSRLKVAKVVGKYKAGLYRHFPDIVQHYRTRKVTILCDGPTAVNLDGELRRAQRVEISLAKEKLRFFYPDTVTLLPGQEKT